MKCQLHSIALVSIILALTVILYLLFRNIVKRYAYACCYDEKQYISIQDDLWLQVSKIASREITGVKNLNRLICATAIDSIARLTSFVDDSEYFPPVNVIDWKLIEPKGHDRAASVCVTSNKIAWISFRGTVTKSEWLDIDLEKGFVIIGGRTNKAEYKSHRGITDYYNKKLRSLILDALNSHSEILGIVVTGHSLGGGLSIICSADIVLPNSAYPKVPVLTLAYAPPRVCSCELAERLTHMNSTLHVKGKLNLKAIVNTSDVVPDAPAAVTPDMNAFHHKVMYRYQHPSTVYTFNATKESLLLCHSLVTYKDFVDSLSQE